MNMRILGGAGCLWLALTFGACTQADQSDQDKPAGPQAGTELPAGPDSSEHSSVPAVQTPVPAASVAATSQAVLEALHEQDMARLARMVHPVKGLRFTRDTYVRKTDVVLMPDELEPQWASDEKLLWDESDTSGEPVRLSFREYADRYIWSHNFMAKEVEQKQCEPYGITINNIAEFYPEATCEEFFYPDHGGGMDWAALKLVYEPHEGQKKLVGLVHGEWTP